MRNKSKVLRRVEMLDQLSNKKSIREERQQTKVWYPEITNSRCRSEDSMSSCASTESNSTNFSNTAQTSR